MTIGMMPANINYSFKEDFLPLNSELKSGELFWSLSPHNNFDWINYNCTPPCVPPKDPLRYNILWLSNYSSLFQEGKNVFKLIKGNFPQNSSEILADGRFYNESDVRKVILLYNKKLNSAKNVSISGIFNITDTCVIKELYGKAGFDEIKINYDRPMIFAHIDFGIQILNNFTYLFNSDDEYTREIPMTIHIFYKVFTSISSIHQLATIENEIQSINSKILALNFKDYYFMGGNGKLVQALTDLDEFNQLLKRLFLWNTISIFNFEIFLFILLQRNLKEDSKIIQKQLEFGLSSSNLEKIVSKSFLKKVSFYFGLLVVLAIGITFILISTKLRANFIISLFFTTIIYLIINYFNFKYTLRKNLHFIQDKNSKQLYLSDEQDFISYIKAKKAWKRGIILFLLTGYLIGFLVLMWNQNLVSSNIIFLPYISSLISFFLPQWIIGLYLLCFFGTLLLRPLFKYISLKIQILFWKIQKNKIGLWLFPRITNNKKGIKSFTFIVTMLLCFNILFCAGFQKFFLKSEADQEELNWASFNLNCEFRFSPFSDEYSYESVQQNISSLETQLKSANTIQIAYGNAYSYGFAFINPSEYSRHVPKNLIKISSSVKNIEDLDQSENECFISKELAKKEGLSVGNYITLAAFDNQNFLIVGIIERAPLLKIDIAPEEIQIVLSFNLLFGNYMQSFHVFFEVPATVNLQDFQYSLYVSKDPLIESISIRQESFSFNDLPFLIRFMQLQNILNFLCLGMLWWNNGYDYYKLRYKEFDRLKWYGYSKKNLNQSVFTEMFADNFSIFIIYALIFSIILVFIRQIFVLFFNLNYSWPTYFSLNKLDLYYNDKVCIHGYSISKTSYVSFYFPLEFFLILIQLGLISFIFLMKHQYLFNKKNQ
ncbi:hypothetical protein [Candidatus Harpocratesius sp.]